MNTGHIGFTGSRQGMAPDQKLAFSNLLRGLRGSFFHHGDCVGADCEAHHFAQVLGLNIVIHPPCLTHHRAYCKGAVFTHHALPYIERNHRIVNASEFLIACPKGYSEELRSGTWSTIRYAKKVHCKFIIVLPDGTISI